MPVITAGVPVPSLVDTAQAAVVGGISSFLALAVLTGWFPGVAGTIVQQGLQHALGNAVFALGVFGFFAVASLASLWILRPWGFLVVGPRARVLGAIEATEARLDGGGDGESWAWYVTYRYSPNSLGGSGATYRTEERIDQTEYEQLEVGPTQVEYAVRRPRYSRRMHTANRERSSSP